MYNISFWYEITHEIFSIRNTKFSQYKTRCYYVTFQSLFYFTSLIYTSNYDQKDR